MFSKTGQAVIEINGKSYHVGRMGPIIAADVSKVLISGRVMPFLQIDDMTGAAIMALMDLPDDKLKMVANASLEKSKDPEGNQITQLSFNGNPAAYWKLVAKVLFANFTELALYLETERGKLTEYAKAAEMARRLQRV